MNCCGIIDHTLRLMVAGALASTIATPSAMAQDVEVDTPGATIRVGPDRGAERGVGPAGGAIVIDGAPGQAQPPGYWIGIAGGPVTPALQSQLDLGDGGVLVQDVTPDSPAADNLEPWDIIIAANGEPIGEIRELVDAVNEVGPDKGQLSLEIIRKGQRQTVWVTPSERPPMPEPQRGFGLGGEGGPFGLRIGPGGAPGGMGDVAVNFGGTQVHVTQQDGRTNVHVKRGDQEWNIDATDPEALEQLPPDIRAMVEGVIGGNGMLGGFGGGGGPDVDIDIERILPELEGLFRRGRGGERGPRGDREVDERIEQLQRQVERLQRQMGVEPQEGGEAPAFDPADNEVEIPNE